MYNVSGRIGFGRFGTNRDYILLIVVCLTPYSNILFFILGKFSSLLRGVKCPAHSKRKQWFGAEIMS